MPPKKRKATKEGPSSAARKRKAVKAKDSDSDSFEEKAAEKRKKTKNDVFVLNSVTEGRGGDVDVQVVGCYKTWGQLVSEAKKIMAEEPEDVYGRFDNDDEVKKSFDERYLKEPLSHDHSFDIASMEDENCNRFMLIASVTSLK